MCNINFDTQSQERNVLIVQIAFLSWGSLAEIETPDCKHRDGCAERVHCLCTSSGGTNHVHKVRGSVVPLIGHCGAERE